MTEGTAMAFVELTAVDQSSKVEGPVYVNTDNVLWFKAQAGTRPGRSVIAFAGGATLAVAEPVDALKARLAGLEVDGPTRRVRAVR
ncbi:hypothetical protein [Azospirillum sp. A39]|uniref:hypothetical protein n=1 Tax=Azospirillum sp. A39 TaxID=3462279 RepID=UPI0040454F29